MCSDATHKLKKEQHVMSQSEIRQSVLQSLASLSDSDREEAAAKVYLQVTEHPFYKRAEKIAFYRSIQYEIDLSLCILRSEKSGKSIYFPITDPKDKHKLLFAPYNPNLKWVKNIFNVEEPEIDHEEAISAEHMDLIIMPLVAADPYGHRVGRGKGCYDRTLSFLNDKGRKPPPFLLGLCHACQMVSFITPNPWDIQLHEVLAIRT
jgi:5-formyltetrahydrofolate cyclo-ligase